MQLARACIAGGLVLCVAGGGDVADLGTSTPTDPDSEWLSISEFPTRSRRPRVVADEVEIDSERLCYAPAAIARQQVQIEAEMAAMRAQEQRIHAVQMQQQYRPPQKHY